MRQSNGKGKSPKLLASSAGDELQEAALQVPELREGGSETPLQDAVRGIQPRHRNSADMSQAITSDGSSAIERQVHMPADDARARGPVALEAFYDIVGAGDFVRSGNFRKVGAFAFFEAWANVCSALERQHIKNVFFLQVALQFPDWLLPDAVDVLSALEVRKSQPLSHTKTHTAHARRRPSARLKWSCMCLQTQVTVRTAWMRWLHRYGGVALQAC